MYTRIGITASRFGLSGAQESRLFWALEELRTNRGAKYLHHGDCLGGDHIAALRAKALGYTVVGHPPVADGLRAFFPSDEEREPQDYLTRDRALVDEVDLLFGCPRTEMSQPRSGTWYTISYAIDIGTKTVIIRPDGGWSNG